MQCRRGPGTRCTYRVSLDVARNQLHGLGVHGHGARDENHAIGLDGLAVNARERLGSLVGEDSSLGGHCVWLDGLMRSWGELGVRDELMDGEVDDDGSR